MSLSPHRISVSAEHLVRVAAALRVPADENHLTEAEVEYVSTARERKSSANLLRTLLKIEQHIDTCTACREHVDRRKPCRLVLQGQDHKAIQAASQSSSAIHVHEQASSEEAVEPPCGTNTDQALECAECPDAPRQFKRQAKQPQAKSPQQAHESFGREQPAPEELLERLIHTLVLTAPSRGPPKEDSAMSIRSGVLRYTSKDDVEPSPT